MPRRRPFPPAFLGLLVEQDNVVSREQALRYGLSANVIQYLLDTGRWQAVLPRVYAVASADLSPRQRMIAALLQAEWAAALDGLTVLRCLGVRHLPADDRICIVTQRQLKSRDFVVVRRTPNPIRLDPGAPLPRLPASDALISACIGRTLDQARAMVSEVVQRGFASYDELVESLQHAPRRGSANVRCAISDVRAGCRSAPEAEFRDLVVGSAVLPEPRWNQWLALTDGTVLGCADGYWDEAALVHEVDGRDFHFWGRDSEQTAERHARYTAGGLTVMHTSPWRIRRQGTEVLRSVEAAYLAGRRRGPSPEVVMIDPPPWAAHR